MSIYQDHLTKRQTQETQATELLVALAKLASQNANVLFLVSVWLCRYRTSWQNTPKQVLTWRILLP